MLALLVGAGVALLVIAQLDGEAAEPAAPPPAPAPVGQPPAGPGFWPAPGQAPPAPPARDRSSPATSPQASPAASPPGSPSSAAPEPQPPHDHSGTTQSETLDPAAARQVVAVADQFATIWADPAPDWSRRLADLSTPALAASLAGADPPQPAPRISGAAQVLFEAPAWARVAVPADRGTVVLDVVAVGDRWLVSAVDWRPA